MNYNNIDKLNKYTLKSNKYNSNIYFYSENSHYITSEINKKITDLNQIKKIYSLIFNNITYDINKFLDLLYIVNQFNYIDISENFFYFIVNEIDPFLKIIQQNSLINNNMDNILQQYGFKKYINSKNSFTKHKIIYYNDMLLSNINNNYIFNLNITIENIEQNENNYFNQKNYLDLYILNQLVTNNYIISIKKSIFDNINIKLLNIDGYTNIINDIQQQYNIYNVKILINIISDFKKYKIYKLKIQYTIIIIFYYFINYQKKKANINILQNIDINYILFNLNIINHLIFNDINDFFDNSTTLSLCLNMISNYDIIEKFNKFLLSNDDKNLNISKYYLNTQKHLPSVFHVIFYYKLDENFIGHLTYNKYNDIYLKTFKTNINHVLYYNLYNDNYLNKLVEIDNHLIYNNKINNILEILILGDYSDIQNSFY